MILSELKTMARERFPRQYDSEDLHSDDCDILAKEKGTEFLATMARRHDYRLDGSDIASLLNAVAPDNCRVVGSGDYDEMRDYALKCWKLLSGIIHEAEDSHHEDPLGQITDLINDARRFNNFARVEYDMKQITENNDMTQSPQFRS